MNQANKLDIGPLLKSINQICTQDLPNLRAADKKVIFPDQILKKFWDLGLAGTSVSAEFGGSQLPYWQMAEITKTIANHDLGLAIVVSVHNMCAAIINRSATQIQKELWLPKIATGEQLCAFALTEPEAGSDAKALKTNFIQDGQDFILNGQKCYISSAGFADLYLVFAKSSADQAISCFVTPKHSAGLSFGIPESKMAADLSPIASIFLDQVRLNQQQLLGDLGQGYQLALAALAGGRLNIASCAVGISESAILCSIRHLKTRKQFGHTLAEFQGLQFMLADMDIKLRSSLALTREAAQVLDNNGNPGEQNYRAALAKCAATDAAMAITTDAVQLLGGAGYIRDYQVERLMREAKMLQIVEGTNQIQRIIIAKALINSIN